jgi:hypothetical protein
MRCERGPVAFLRTVRVGSREEAKNAKVGRVRGEGGSGFRDGLGRVRIFLIKPARFWPSAETSGGGHGDMAARPQGSMSARVNESMAKP